jgi:hypothetical protein
MARDPRAQAALALHRFAFAPKPGVLASINDARAALIGELENPAAGQIKNDGLLSSGEAARAAFDFRQERKAARLAARAGDETGTQQAKEVQTSASQPEMAQPQARQTAPRPNPGPFVPQQIYLEEAKARLDSALDANFGFVERYRRICLAHAGGLLRAYRRRRADARRPCPPRHKNDWTRTRPAGFGRRPAVQARVCIDKRQILALLGREGFCRATHFGQMTSPRFLRSPRIWFSISHLILTRELG